MRIHTVQLHITTNKVLDVKISVGQNDRENHELVASADEDELWCHVSGKPSCHVVAHLSLCVLDNLNPKEYKKAIRLLRIQCAVLCKRYSKYASERNVPFEITPISNVIIPDESSKSYRVGTVQLENMDLVKKVFI